MNVTRELLERVGEGFTFPDAAFERLERRRDRKRRNERITAGTVGFAIFVAMVWIATTGGPLDRSQTPAVNGPTVPPVFTLAPPPAGSERPGPGGSGVDYLIDLKTGVKTPLPKSIIRSVAESGWVDGLDGSIAWHAPRYAVSPDGSQLAFVGTGDEGSLQIFTAGIDGTGVRQATHDPTGAMLPAWSPDGTMIAYEGYGSGDVLNLLVLDVATGESTSIAGAGRVQPWAQPQFTPDGSSLLYTGGGSGYPLLLTVSVSGGQSTLLIGPGEGVTDAGNGSMSPDGSLVTFLGSGTPPSGRPGHCGPCRFVANADGTERRVIPGWIASPAGTWSPDSSRIVCTDFSGHIIVVDIATGVATRVADGLAAIWLGEHKLLVEA